MNLVAQLCRHFVRKLSVVGAVLSVVLLTGCVSPSYYVDTATKDVPIAEFKKPAQAKDVQLIFDFQTKGAPNAAATNFLKPQVVEQLQGSGLFAKVDSNPVSGAGILNVVINNIPEADAASKGFKTGLTFGASGTTVTDNYLCTITYLPPGDSKGIVKTVQHALHTSVGNTTPPANATKAESIEVAVRTMSKQILANALKALSLDPVFR